MIRFHWGDHWDGWQGSDVRFVTARYRAGGPWMIRRMVHNLDAKYGVSFRTKQGWKFFGLLSLSGQRTTNEPAAEVFTE